MSEPLATKGPVQSNPPRQDDMAELAWALIAVGRRPPERWMVALERESRAEAAALTEPWSW